MVGTIAERKMDIAKIYVKGGDGGNGCISFRREKHVPKGGPNGGDGGNGGNVILQAIESLTTLIDQVYTQQYKATRGQHGKGKLMHGKDGEDRIVKVPVGTIVRDADTGELLADITKPDMQIVVAKGGQGGKGNAHFRSSTNQAPRVAEKGEPGHERWLALELKLIADIGLVGYPNVGKSSLLARTSAARPKIADYPFTTLSPNLGVVRLDYEKSFVLADIPGLIEGAHKGVGLGDDFLRHIERTKMLIHVIDAAALEGRDPIEDYQKINEELLLYDSKLASLPQLIAPNKMDMPSAQANLLRLQAYFGERKIYPISALTGEGVSSLMNAAFSLLQEINQKRKQEEQMKPPQVAPIEYTHKPEIEITQKGGKFIVKGEDIRRAVLMTDMENPEALILLHRKLKNMGVINGLLKMGVKDGDTVQLDEIEFTFSADGIQPPGPLF
jgi:GTP-binding protein